MAFLIFFIGVGLRGRRVLCCLYLCRCVHRLFQREIRLSDMPALRHLHHLPHFEELSRREENPFVGGQASHRKVGEVFKN